MQVPWQGVYEYIAYKCLYQRPQSTEDERSEDMWADLACDGYSEPSGLEDNSLFAVRGRRIEIVKLTTIEVKVSRV
jgi:hypothetical protein